MEFQAGSMPQSKVSKLTSLIGYPGRRFLQRKLAQWVLPTQATGLTAEEATAKVEQLFLECTKSHKAQTYGTAYVADLETHTILTADQVRLRVYWFYPAERTEHHDAYTVHFLSNSEIVEQRATCRRLCRECSALGRNIIAFNYRGTMTEQSSAQCYLDLVRDGYSVVYFLLAQGIAPDRIVLTGTAIGASCALSLARILNESSITQGIRVFTHCGFTSFSAATTGLVIRNIFDYFGYARFGRAVAAVVGFGVIKPLFMLLGWECYSYADFQRIADPLKKGIYIAATDDSVIHPCASLGARILQKYPKSDFFIPVLRDKTSTLLGHYQSLQVLRTQAGKSAEAIYFEFLSDTLTVIIAQAKAQKTPYRVEQAQ